jgi:hypothetical protein
LVQKRAGIRTRPPGPEGSQDRREDPDIGNGFFDPCPSRDAVADKNERDMDLIESDRMAVGEVETVLSQGFPMIRGHDKESSRMALLRLKIIHELEKLAVSVPDFPVITPNVIIA